MVPKSERYIKYFACWPLDCSWRKEIGSSQEGFKVKKFYVMSLHTRGNAILDGIPTEDIVNNGEHLLVNLTCRDARGELYTTKFDIDFHRISSENRNIAYQYDDNLLPTKTG
jgi:hypothetical protein